MNDQLTIDRKVCKEEYLAYQRPINIYSHILKENLS